MIDPSQPRYFDSTSPLIILSLPSLTTTNTSNSQSSKVENEYIDIYEEAAEIAIKQFPAPQIFPKKFIEDVEKFSRDLSLLTSIPALKRNHLPKNIIENDLAMRVATISNQHFSMGLNNYTYYIDNIHFTVAKEFERVIISIDNPNFIISSTPNKKRELLIIAKGNQLQLALGIRNFSKNKNEVRNIEIDFKKTLSQNFDFEFRSKLFLYSVKQIQELKKTNVHPFNFITYKWNNKYKILIYCNHLLYLKDNFYNIQSYMPILLSRIFKTTERDQLVDSLNKSGEKKIGKRVVETFKKMNEIDFNKISLNLTLPRIQ